MSQESQKNRSLSCKILQGARLPCRVKGNASNLLGFLGEPTWGSDQPPPHPNVQHRPTRRNRETRGLRTPTAPTAPNFHSALCLSGFSLAQRLVCHLCHKHCRQRRISGGSHVLTCNTRERPGHSGS